MTEKQKKERSFNGRRSVWEICVSEKSWKWRRKRENVCVTSQKLTVTFEEIEYALRVIERQSVTIESGYSPIKRVIYHQFETLEILSGRNLFSRRKQRDANLISLIIKRRQVSRGKVANSKICFRQPGRGHRVIRSRSRANVFVTINSQLRPSLPRTWRKLRKAIPQKRKQRKNAGVYFVDYHFLMSFHHRLNKMPLVRKMKVKARREAQTIFYEEHTGRRAPRRVRTILRYVVPRPRRKSVIKISLTMC